MGLLSVTETEDLIITCKSGITIRTSIQQIREAGRATQGVKLIKLDENDEIAAISQIEEQEEPAAIENGNDPISTNTELEENSNLDPSIQEPS